MPFPPDTFAPPRATRIVKAFDDAFSLVLNQLARDLKLRAHEEPPNSFQQMSAEDLRQVARICLEEAKSSSNKARKLFLTERALSAAQLAEKAVRDAEDKSA